MSLGSIGRVILGKLAKRRGKPRLGAEALHVHSAYSTYRRFTRKRSARSKGRRHARTHKRKRYGKR